MKSTLIFLALVIATSILPENSFAGRKPKAHKMKPTQSQSKKAKNVNKDDKKKKVSPKTVEYQEEE